MSTHKLLTAVLLASAVALPPIFAPSAAAAAVRGAERAAGHCVFGRYQVTAVKAYKVEESAGKATKVSRLKGARIFVQAEPGLTAEWLELEIGRHLRQMQGTTMKNCALQISGVRAEAASAGSGFWVTITAPDEQKANQVLERARLLLR